MTTDPSDPGPVTQEGQSTSRSTYTRSRTNCMLTPCQASSKPAGTAAEASSHPSRVPLWRSCPPLARWSHTACIHALCLPCRGVCPQPWTPCLLSLPGQSLADHGHLPGVCSCPPGWLCLNSRPELFGNHRCTPRSGTKMKVCWVSEIKSRRMNFKRHILKP